MREKNASKQQVVTTGFQLDSEYFNHVIKLSYYFPKNNQERRCALHLLLKLQFVLSFPVSPAYRFITTIICSLDIVPFSYMDSC